LGIRSSTAFNLSLLVSSVITTLLLITLNGSSKLLITSILGASPRTSKK